MFQESDARQEPLTQCAPFTDTITTIQAGLDRAIELFLTEKKQFLEKVNVVGKRLPHRLDRAIYSLTVLARVAQIMFLAMPTKQKKLVHTLSVSPPRPSLP